MPVILITGGARSGKSRHAETRARAFAGRPVYIATAEALDGEMAERIASHRARRGSEWIEREEPLELAQALIETDSGGARLVDCLTLWLSNLLHAGRDWQQWAVMAFAAVFAVIGTTLSRGFLDRLSDKQFYYWTRRVILALGAVYIAQGLWQMAAK